MSIQVRKPNRRASSTRLTVLLLFLVVVGAGCIFEFAFARPTYQKAWDKIREVDEASDSSEYTAEEIQKMVGQEPFAINEDIHEDCVVHTYRWRSGLLVKHHDIHVVFTKFSDAMIKKRPELEGKLHYYSASAGQPLDLDTNFPKEKQTIVENLNPPMMSMGGGGAPPQGGRGGNNNRDDDDAEGGQDEAAAGDQTESGDDHDAGEHAEGEGHGEGEDHEHAEGEHSEGEGHGEGGEQAEGEAGKSGGEAEKGDEKAEEKSKTGESAESKKAAEKTEGGDSKSADKKEGDGKKKEKEESDG